MQKINLPPKKELGKALHESIRASNVTHEKIINALGWSRLRYWSSLKGDKNYDNIIKIQSMFLKLK